MKFSPRPAARVFLLAGLCLAGLAAAHPAAAQDVLKPGSTVPESAGPLPSLNPPPAAGSPNASTGAAGIITAAPATPTGQNPSIDDGVAAPAPIGNAAGPATPTLNAVLQNNNSLVPFGASLFPAGVVPQSSSAPNPNYIIQPGDTVSIQAYGGVTSSVTAPVDSQGNVFLPSFGPVHVAGIMAANLQATVQQSLAHAFTSNVNVYAVLESETSISVFVAGFVKAPGQYLGSASDSALDFLARAGGVDPARGSYRDIELMRGGVAIENIDLYRFMLAGAQIPLDLHNGDTIFVGKQLPLVAAAGAVRNNYLFELQDPSGAGASLLQLAQPLPSATDALITGTRFGQPYSKYVTVSALPETPLQDQDQVTFVADATPATITVQVQGSRIGPSVLIARNDTTLKTLLAYIHVDPGDAATPSVYIIRPGLAAQQEAAIQAALDRLQKALYYATSVTTGEAQIRATEAQSIQAYINAARSIAPDGVLAVADDNNVQSDIRMENGDIIVIPEKSDTVMVDGEVESPQALKFDPNANRATYIALAGGPTERGQVTRSIIKRLSGRLVLDPDGAIMPGDELIVLPYVETENFVITEDVLSLIYQVAASTYFASKL
jgi:protein involved in polysaccharide export with SLBB domain